MLSIPSQQTYKLIVFIEKDIMKRITLFICLLSGLMYSACSSESQETQENQGEMYTCGSIANPVSAVILEDGTVCTAGSCILNGTACPDEKLDVCDEIRAANVFSRSNCPTGEYVCGVDENAKTVCAHSCAAGKEMCGVTCHDLTSDRDHCGNCTTKCASGLVCQSGQCTDECTNGLNKCGSHCLNMDAVSVASCDETGNITCKEGYSDCDGNPANGCETDISADRNHCGSCDKTCESDEFCAGGKCDRECPAADGYFVCNENCISFAEKHLLTCDSCQEGWCSQDGDMSNGCEFSAYANHLTKTCDACEENWCDLDGNVSNGCEKSIDELNRADCSTCAEHFGDCDGDATNGCERNLNADVENCGACGNSCNSGEFCVDGKCSLDCPAADGYFVCHEQCMNLDEQHWSRCDVCQEGWCNHDEDTANGCELSAYARHLSLDCGACEAGWCDIDNDLADGCEKSLNELHRTDCSTCMGNFGDCDGDLTNGCELDLSSDDENCGACGNACQSGEHCVKGHCSSECPAEDGYFLCNGGCVDLAAQHQIFCETCMTGWCSLDDDMSNGCEFSAHEHHLDKTCQKCEDGWCDLDDQIQNGCEKSLDELHQSSCSVCLNGYGDCDEDASNGCEQDLTSNHEHCGACGHACKSFEYCVQSECVSSCSAEYGLIACGDNCLDLTKNHLASCDVCRKDWCNLDNDMVTNGCEMSANDVHLRSDCSACASGYCDLDEQSGNGCESEMAALHLASCDGCENGWCNADGDLKNGCEENTMTSSTNCGSCGNVCDPGFSCYDGLCQKCPTGQTGCDDTCIDLAAMHWVDCSGTCIGGYADCDGDASNGCELNIASDVLNCGGCGRECKMGYECVSGTCAVQCELGETRCDVNTCRDLSLLHWKDCDGTCALGYADCDGEASNGCETDINTAQNHCGACNTSCGEGFCNHGTCACDSGLTYCNTKCVDTKTDIYNCGSCGNDVHWLRNTTNVTCVNGNPHYNCNPNRADCNGDYHDGCEIYLDDDNNNCGMCGVTCSAPEVCQNNYCRECSEGTTYCSGECVDLMTNRYNCGSCGAAVWNLPNVDTVECSGGIPQFTCYEWRYGRYRDCDNDPWNGCEYELPDGASTCPCPEGETYCESEHACFDLQNDLTHCGACDRNYSNVPDVKTKACVNGQLQITCEEGQANCNYDTQDGCEINIEFDTDHCGSCHYRCGTGEYCIYGECKTL